MKGLYLQRVRIPPGNCRSSQKHLERFEDAPAQPELTALPTFPRTML